MVGDAETHAEEDRRQRELVEARNNAENAAYQAERQLGELGESVDEGSRTEIEAAIKEVRDSLGSEDAAEIQGKTQALQESFHRVSEQMYAAAAQQAEAADAGAPGPDGAGATNGAAADEEEVVDAEVVEGESR
jgi:molecular chaperone DnaK